MFDYLTSANINKSDRKVAAMSEIWELRENNILNCAELSVGYARLTNCSQTFPRTEANLVNKKWGTK